MSGVLIGTLLRLIFGHIPSFSENVVCIDLFRLILTLHFSYHSDNWLRCTCKFDEAINRFSLMDEITLSSA